MKVKRILWAVVATIAYGFVGVGFWGITLHAIQISPGSDVVSNPTGGYSYIPTSGEGADLRKESDWEHLYKALLFMGVALVSLGIGDYCINACNALDSKEIKAMDDDE